MAEFTFRGATVFAIANHFASKGGDDPVFGRYSYVYEGNSQVLDQILISTPLTIAPPGAKGPAFDYDIVHTSSEFFDQDSEHDPQVVRLAIRGGRG